MFEEKNYMFFELRMILDSAKKDPPLAPLLKDIVRTITHGRKRSTKLSRLEIKKLNFTQKINF